MSGGGTRLRVFVATVPGLEALLAAELGELGFGGRADVGGVELMATPAGVAALCLASRLAESVRVRVARFAARDFATLEARLARVPWHAWLPSAAPEVSVTCHRSRLYHSDAVAERVLRAIAGALGERGGAAAPPRVFARLVSDVVTLSVEAGERLHRRGWRSHVGDAPLRETLAAAVLRLAAVPRAAPLVDPFCGAGTIVLEAAEQRSGRPPARLRPLALEAWPTFRAAWLDGDGEPRGAPVGPAPADTDTADTETAHLEAAGTDTAAPDTAERAALAGECLGSDRDEAAVRAARHNLASLAPAAPCRFERADAERALAAAPAGAFVVTNPPWDRRLSDSTLASAYAELGARWGRAPRLGGVAVLTGWREAARHLGPRFEAIASFPAGGHPVRVFVGR